MHAFLLALLLMSPAAAPERVVDFPTARAYLPFQQPARYKGAFGGRGSAKSHDFAKNLVKRCVQYPGTRWVCVREIQRTLEQSVKRLLEDKIAFYGVEDLFESTNSVIRTPGDGVIIFQGMQDHTAESVKSLEGFHGAWVEEAQSLSERSLRLLRPTIREKGSELWFTWNPRFPTDPVDVLFRGGNPPPDSVLVNTSFRDNPWFPDVLRLELEFDRGRDLEMYQHVWEGGYEQKSEARVFKNWKIEEFDDPPLLADGTQDWAWLFGGDWGFSVDPTVLVRMHAVGRTLYIGREVYRIGVEIDHIPAFFDQIPGSRSWPIVADSARPETISYLQRHGFPLIQPAIKGQDSVKEGVIFLQGMDIIIHPRCVRTIDEFTHYSYKVDKASGLVLPVLEDKKNHVIDSVRYGVEKLRLEAAGFVSW